MFTGDLHCYTFQDDRNIGNVFFCNGNIHTENYGHVSVFAMIANIDMAILWPIIAIIMAQEGIILKNINKTKV